MIWCRYWCRFDIENEGTWSFYSKGVDQRRKPPPEAELRVLQGLERRLAEACGGRTHQPVISGFAGFEDQEGHRAHSASALSEDSGGSEMLSSYFRRPEAALSPTPRFD